MIKTDDLSATERRTRRRQNPAAKLASELPDWFQRTKAGEESLIAAREQALAERRAAVAEIAEIERRRARELPPLEAEAHELGRRAENIRQQLDIAQRDHQESLRKIEALRFDLQIAHESKIRFLKRTCDPKIHDLADWLLGELYRTQNMFRTWSEQTDQLAPTTGYERIQHNNGVVVSARMDAIKRATTEAENLKLAVGEDVDARIAKLRASIPPDA